MEKVLGMFIEGVLSFFSPCVLPLIPLYMSYLSSGTIYSNGNTKIYNQKKTLILTILFILGICSTFTLLAYSVSSLNKYINNYRSIIGLLGGIILIIFGLNQIGLIKINILNKELKFDYRITNNKVNYLEAFMLGFVFSFAWTPCIGPMLTNAIILSTQDSLGSLYIIIYALGLVVPFLITGLFTTKVLKFINSNKKIVKYTSFISGSIVILFGIYMITNLYSTKIDSQIVKNGDQYLPREKYNLLSGDIVDFSKKSEKKIVLDFITSWCNYCKQDLPYFEEFCNNHDELTCYLVMSEKANRINNGTTTIDFYNEYKPGIEIIIDDDSLTSNFRVNGFPSLFIIAENGRVLGNAPGALFDNFELFYSSIKKN